MARVRAKANPVAPVGESQTKASEGNVTDVNVILNRYMRTGELPQFNGRVPVYGDFTEVTTLQDALNHVMEAEEAFMDLPAQVRDVAGHDPVRFLEMLASQEGTERLINAGLDPEGILTDEERAERLTRAPTPTPKPSGSSPEKPVETADPQAEQTS